MNVATGKVALKGEVTGPHFQKDVNEEVWIADFSDLVTPGEYYLNIPGVGRSV